MSIVGKIALAVFAQFMVKHAVGKQWLSEMSARMPSAAVAV
jgi:hypothetical protein